MTAHHFKTSSRACDLPNKVALIRSNVSHFIGSQRLLKIRSSTGRIEIVRFQKSEGGLREAGKELLKSELTILTDGDYMLFNAVGNVPFTV